MNAEEAFETFAKASSADMLSMISAQQNEMGTEIKAIANAVNELKQKLAEHDAEHGPGEEEDDGGKALDDLLAGIGGEEGSEEEAPAEGEAPPEEGETSPEEEAPAEEEAVTKEETIKKSEGDKEMAEDEKPFEETKEEVKVDEAPVEEAPAEGAGADEAPEKETVETKVTEDMPKGEEDTTDPFALDTVIYVPTVGFVAWSDVLEMPEFKEQILSGGAKNEEKAEEVKEEVTEEEESKKDEKPEEEITEEMKDEKVEPTEKGDCGGDDIKKSEPDYVAGRIIPSIQELMEAQFAKSKAAKEPAINASRPTAAVSYGSDVKTEEPFQKSGGDFKNLKDAKSVNDFMKSDWDSYFAGQTL